MGKLSVILDLNQFKDSAPQQIKQRIPPVERTQNISRHLDDHIMTDAVQHLMLQDHPIFRSAKFVFRKKDDRMPQPGDQRTGIQSGTDHSYVFSGWIFFLNGLPDLQDRFVFAGRQSPNGFLYPTEEPEFLSNQKYSN